MSNKAAGGEAFGTVLRGHRAVAGLTQEDLAKLAGLSVRAVANWERGRARPRRQSVALLSDALALSARQRKLFTQVARAEPGAGRTAMPQLAAAEPGNGSQPAAEVSFQLPAAPWHVVDRAAELDQVSVWVRVLGPVQVRGGDGWVRPAGPQVRLLLGRLGLSAGQVVLVDDLMDVLWAQRPPPSARASLQILVVGLRKALAGLPGCAVERYGDGYQLRAAPDMVDVHRFRSLVCAARGARDGDQAFAAFDEALALWRGPALSDVPATPRVEAIRAGLGEEHLSAVQDRFGCLLAAGRHQEAAAEIPLVLAGHPLAERLAGMLMIAWYRCGRQDDALRVFRDLRARLAGELAVEPGPELQRLHQQILSGDRALAAPDSLARLRRGGQVAAAASDAGGDGVIWPVRPARPADAPERPGGDKDAEGAERRGSRELRMEAGPGLDQRVWARGPGAQFPPGSGKAGRAGTESMSAVVVPRQLPAAPAHFVGRQRELGLLTGWLDAATAAGQRMILAIGGSAGAGKTALALHWAHQVKHRFPDGQLYVNLRGYSPCGDPTSTYSAIRTFLEALQVSPDRIPAGPEAQAGLYRSLLAGRSTLILLDNARDADHVRALLPGSGGCLVVVTSRGRLAGLAATEEAHPIWLDVLNHVDARSLLVGRLGADRLGTGGLVDELIELCARLPLALSVTAARIAEHPDFPLSSIVEQLRDERHRLDALDTGESASGVRSVLSCSYEQLSDSAARMFRLLGLHPGPDVTVPAAASLAAVSQVSARHAIDELTRCSLLSEHSPGRFARHDLLRNYAVELTSVQDTEADRQAALRRVLDHYLQCSVALSQSLDPTREQIRVLSPAAGAVTERILAPADAHAWFEAEHHVLMAAVAKAARGGFDVHAWQLPWAIENMLSRRGRWHDMNNAHRMALQAAVRLGDLTGQAHALRGLGRACAMIGALDEGRCYLERALQLFDQLGDDAAHARAHVHMAQALSRMRRYSDAVRHAERARELFRIADHKAGQAGAMNNIGLYHIQLGNHEQALACTQRALAGFRQLSDRRGEAIALDSLGEVHQHLGHYAPALEHCHEALSVARELKDARLQANIFVHLGDAYHALGDDIAARNSWTEALRMLEEPNPAHTDQLRAKLRSLPPMPFGAQAVADGVA